MHRVLAACAGASSRSKGSTEPARRRSPRAWPTGCPARGCCASPAGARSPGGVELSERIRELVKDPALEVDPRAEALLYAAARAQLVASLVRPLLDDGVTVLLDRFVDSSLAYQGAGRELGIEAVRAINDFGTEGLVPDVTLLLRIDPAAGRARQEERGEAPDRLELEARAGPRPGGSARAAFSSGQPPAPTTSSPRPSRSGSTSSTPARRRRRCSPL